MMNLRAITLLSIILLAFNPLFSQDKYQLYDEEKTVLLKNEFMGGITLHSSGFGLDLRRGYHITGYKKGVFEIEIVGMKHPKEIRTVNPRFDNAKSYIYGKSNSLTILRGMYGIQNVLYSKAEKSGIQVRYTYSGGFALGMAKPVYLEILPNTFPLEARTTIERYDPNIHFTDNIFGRAPFFTGVDEMKFYPGLSAKSGISFEYSHDHERLKVLEVGVALDAFAKPVPIMALIDNKQFYVSFYINVLFGRRW
ncbi:MAG: hypothetical protein ACR2GN_05380 [Bacteroidia bacterium]